MTTAPFARWRDQYRDRPGQLPTREVLAALDAATVVGVRADVLRQLVVQAENHEADARYLCGTESDEPCLVCIARRARREIEDAESLSVETRTP